MGDGETTGTALETSGDVTATVTVAPPTWSTVYVGVPRPLADRRSG